MELSWDRGDTPHLGKWPFAVGFLTVNGAWTTRKD